MRTAAAAAIVFVVAGGGWGVYTRVQQGQPARMIVMPARMPVCGRLLGRRRHAHAADPARADGARSQQTATLSPKPKNLMHAAHSPLEQPAGIAVLQSPAGSKVACKCPWVTRYLLRHEDQRDCEVGTARSCYASFTIALISMPSSASTTAPQNAGPNPVREIRARWPTPPGSLRR